MADTQAFFTPPPRPASRSRTRRRTGRRAGEAGTLRFPSALTTPHPENNTVVARWFPSKAARASNARGTARARR